jgi:hypothetical protein
MASKQELQEHARQPSDAGASPCCGDPYAELPPELRPAPAQKNTGLRKATCPECGLEYWTNRMTDVCLGCSS